MQQMIHGRRRSTCIGNSPISAFLAGDMTEVPARPDTSFEVNFCYGSTKAWSVTCACSSSFMHDTPSWRKLGVTLLTGFARDQVIV